MNRISAALFLSLFLVVSHVARSTHAQPLPMEVLRQADEARGNLKGVEWEVSVLSKEGDRISEMTFFVQARGFDVLATTQAPPKDKGNKLLLVSGNMWFYKPGLSKAVPISQRQKLLGIAAYGDIASTNYANDYDATVSQREAVNDEMCYIYDLKAKTSKTTYDRIRYWVSVKRLVGIKAEYFTLSGKMIKTATMEYANSVAVDGRTREFISKINIQDTLMTINQTVLAFTKTNIKEIPDHVYNLNLLLH